MLQKSAREFLKDAYSDKILKEMAADEKGYTPELWNKMAELGWMALSIPEDYGGIGDFLDLTMVLMEMGRVGLISPFFSSVVLGGSALAAAGDEEQKQKYLPGISEGKLIFTLALLEDKGRYSADEIQTRALKQQGGFVLNGRKLFVTDGNSADYIICAARSDFGITLFIVDAASAGLNRTLLNTITPDKQSELVFNNVAVPESAVLGEEGKGWEILEKIMARAAVARCAEMVGAAERVLDLTLTYAVDRNAFGHPIGAYQSVQHRCADMLIDIEGARNLTSQAAWYINEDLPYEKEVAMAKAWVSQAFRRVCTSAHQVHGAIGFTEDHVLHWYTRRARAGEVSFGDVNYQLEKVAGLSRK